MMQLNRFPLNLLEQRASEFRTHLCLSSVSNETRALFVAARKWQSETTHKDRPRECVRYFFFHSVCTYFEAALSDGVDDEAAAADVTDIGTDDCNDCCCCCCCCSCCCDIGGCCGRVAVAA